MKKKGKKNATNMEEKGRDGYEYNGSNECCLRRQ